MLPLILRPALLELADAQPGTPEFEYWVGMLFFAPAIAGGIFGLLGGYLTDLWGQRRVLTGSILLYAFSALKWGIFVAGLLTVAQFSFWANYLPRMYPLHLRGTGESFAANIGGRMVGTSAALLTTTLTPRMPGASVALAAATVAIQAGT